MLRSFVVGMFEDVAGRNEQVRSQSFLDTKLSVLSQPLASDSYAYRADFNRQKVERESTA